MLTIILNLPVMNGGRKALVQCFISVQRMFLSGMIVLIWDAWMRSSWLQTIVCTHRNTGKHNHGMLARTHSLTASGWDETQIISTNGNQTCESSLSSSLSSCVCVCLCLSVSARLPPPSRPPCLFVVLRVNINQGLLPRNGELQREMEVRETKSWEK